jgi:hypothetical protein
LADEFKHVSVGSDLTQAEWESTASHVFTSQATGDLLYASSSSQLTRLGIGSTGQLLNVGGGLPAWTSTPSVTSIGANHLQFPATQVASADANALDDYEEGTFTPALLFGGGSTGLTYDDRVGRYTKWGDTVFFQAYLNLSAKGSSSGAATVSALPFTSAANNRSTCSLGMGSGASESFTFADWPFAQISVSATAVALYESLNNGTVSTIADTDFNNASVFFVSGVYQV